MSEKRLPAIETIDVDALASERLQQMGYKPELFRVSVDAL